MTAIIDGTPRRHRAADADLADVLELIRESFGYMHDRIDPPSSMLRLSLAGVAAQCDTGEVWSIGDPIRACLFLTVREDSLYLGKLAVAESARRAGLARTLVRLAGARARSLGKHHLDLQTRIELVENHRTFERLGFVRVGEGSHAGHDRATYICMRKRIGDG